MIPAHGEMVSTRRKTARKQGKNIRAHEKIASTPSGYVPGTPLRRHIHAWPDGGERSHGNSEILELTPGNRTFQSVKFYHFSFDIDPAFPPERSDGEGGIKFVGDDRRRRHNDSRLHERDFGKPAASGATKVSSGTHNNLGRRRVTRAISIPNQTCVTSQ
jgi:hypothetical protein